jgi:hypothetical protein
MRLKDTENELTLYDLDKTTLIIIIHNLISANHYFYDFASDIESVAVLSFYPDLMIKDELENDPMCNVVDIFVQKIINMHVVHKKTRC